MRNGTQALRTGGSTTFFPELPPGVIPVPVKVSEEEKSSQRQKSTKRRLTARSVVKLSQTHAPSLGKSHDLPFSGAYTEREQGEPD